MNKADRKKILSSIGADLKMLASKTEKMEIEECEKYISDFDQFLEGDYLKEISIVLDRQNSVIKAKKYFIKSFVGSGRDDFPGDNNWDDLNGDGLHCVISYTDKWHNLPQEEKTSIKEKMKIRWSCSEVDTDFPNLSGSSDKYYSGNSVRIERFSYE